MFNKIIILIMSIISIVPIFYLLICLYFEFNVFKSLNILNDLYYGFIEKREMQKEVYLAAITSILPTIFALLNLFGNASKRYGFARWAKLKDIKKMGLNFKKGIPIAKVKGKTIYVDDPRSAFIQAAPGAGKSAGEAIPILLNSPVSILVTDIKGELYDLTSNYRREVLKNKVYCLSPFDKKTNNFKFNPFSKKITQYLNFNERLRLSKEFSSVLFVKDKNADGHWIDSARDLFVFFAMYDMSKHNESYLYELGRYPKKSGAELLNDEYLEIQAKAEAEGIYEDEMTLFYKQASEDTSLDPLVRDMARAISRIPKKEYGSVVTSYTRALSVFIDYDVAEVTNDMSITYEQLRKENVTIYLKMKEKEIQILSPLIRIFIEAILQNLMDKENKNPNERVILLMDEIIRFGKLEKLIELPAISRAYNLPLYFIGQNEAQIKKFYSQDDLDIISNTCAFNIYFAINSEKEAERVSKEIGTYTGEKESESTQSGKLSKSKSKSKEGIRLVTAQDLLNLKEDELIITVYRHKATPIKANINYYFKDRKMKRIIKKYAIKEDS